MPLLRNYPYFLALFGLTLACQSPEEPSVEPEGNRFEWTDPSLAVAYPGPYTDVDSALIQLASRAIASLSEGHPDNIPFPLSDSVKVSMVNWPISVLDPQEFQTFFTTWHGQYAGVRYEAFNVRAAYNEVYQTHVFLCFGRWQFQSESGDFEDRYSTILLSTDNSGSLTAVTEWAMCWPQNSPLIFQANADPSHFHYFCDSKIGSMEAAVRAVSNAQALFAQDTHLLKTYLADSVQFTSSCGLNTMWSREQLASSVQSNAPFIGVDPISVIPFYQDRQENHVVLVFDFESFIEDGRLKRYSYLRMFILDRQLKIINILIQRRLVPNAVNWDWQDARRS